MRLPTAERQHLAAFITKPSLTAARRRAAGINLFCEILLASGLVLQRFESISGQ
jgi:hypothetical protein